jgi:hypothetical protein
MNFVVKMVIIPDICLLVYEKRGLVKINHIFYADLILKLNILQTLSAYIH